MTLPSLSKRINGGADILEGINLGEAPYAISQKITSQVLTL
jgi:hypothetical protein